MTSLTSSQIRDQKFRHVITNHLTAQPGEFTILENDVWEASHGQDRNDRRRKNNLGEGPLWDVAQQRLYWVIVSTASSIAATAKGEIDRAGRYRRISGRWPYAKAAALSSRWQMDFTPSIF